MLDCVCIDRLCAVFSLSFADLCLSFAYKNWVEVKNLCLKKACLIDERDFILEAS